MNLETKTHRFFYRNIDGTTVFLAVLKGAYLGYDTNVDSISDSEFEDYLNKESFSSDGYLSCNSFRGYCVHGYRYHLLYKTYIFLDILQAFRFFDSWAKGLEFYIEAFAEAMGDPVNLHCCKSNESVFTSSFIEVVFRTNCSLYFHKINPKYALYRDFDKYPVTEADNAVWEIYNHNNVRTPIESATDSQKMHFIQNYLTRKTLFENSSTAFSEVYSICEPRYRRYVKGESNLYII